MFRLPRLVPLCLLAVGCSFGESPNGPRADGRDRAAPQADATDEQPRSSVGYLTDAASSDRTRGMETPASGDSVAAQVSLRTVDWDEVEQIVEGHEGKVVVLDIWTTTCIRCVEEFPHFLKLQEEFGRSELVCISVNCDYDGIRAKPPEHYRPLVLDFLARQPVHVENVMLNVALLDFLDQIDLASTPAILVYDRQGKLAKRFDNGGVTSQQDEFTMDQVTKLIDELLASS